MAVRYWTCRKCRLRHPRRTAKCPCGNKRPAARQAAHMHALNLSYDEYLRRNGGVERCGICGAEPKPGRRLHRDHDHTNGGRPRALLCFRCNSGLRNYMTVEWLESALAYLRRTA